MENRDDETYYIRRAEQELAMAAAAHDPVVKALHLDLAARHTTQRELVNHHSNRAIERARAILRKYVPEGVGLADELIADRRREAERE